MIREKKLFDVIKNIDQYDPDLTVYVKAVNGEELNSQIETILDYESEDDTDLRHSQEKDFKYLLEVFIINEVIEDWIEINKNHNRNYNFSTLELTKMIIHYAVKDSWPEIL